MVQTSVETKAKAKFTAWVERVKNTPDFLIKRAQVYTLPPAEVC